MPNKHIPYLIRDHIHSNKKWFEPDDIPTATTVDWPAALAAEKRYLARIADDVRTFIKQGRTLAQAAKEAGLSEKDAWLLFDEYNARNVSAAFAELEWE